MGILSFLSQLITPQPYEICHLETISAINPNALITSDGSLVSVFRLDGVMRFYSTEQETVILDIISQGLKPIFTDEGYKIDIVLDVDPVGSERYIEQALSGSITTSKQMGYLDDEVTQEEVKILSDLVKPELGYLVVTTFSSSLDRSSLSESIENRKAMMKEYGSDLVYEKNTQNVLKESQQINDNHDSFVSNVKKVMTKWILLSDLSGEQALKEIHALLIRDVKKQYPWFAHTPVTGHKLKLQSDEDFRVETEDISHPPLVEQIIESQFEKSKSSTFRYYEGVCYASLHRHLVGDDAKLSRELINNLRRTVPFRMIYSMVSGTEKIKNKYSTKAGLTTFVARTNPKSVDIRDACTQVVNFARKGGCLVDTYLSFSTWGRDEKECQSRQRALSSALLAWGGERQRPTEYPVEGILSTLPGFSSQTPGKGAPSPIKDALFSSPLIRVRSPWQSGSMMYLTPECKPWALDFDDVQKHHLNLVSGDMGSGKSVKLGVLIRSIMRLSGTSQLPIIGGVDFGPGAHHNANAIRAYLPDNLSDKVYSMDLKDDAYNLLEPQYGYNSLTEPESLIAASFIARVVNGASHNYIHGQLDECIRTLVDRAVSDAVATPRTLDPSLPKASEIEKELRDPQVKQFLKEERSISFLNARNALFMAADRLDIPKTRRLRLVSLSRLAHKYSWPLLSKVAELCETQHIIASMGAFTIGSNTPLINHIKSALMLMVQRFSRILNRYPDNDYSSANILFINAKPIVSQSSDHMKKAWFILAKSIVTKKFWMHPDDVEVFGDPVFKVINRSTAEARMRLVKYYTHDEYKQSASEELNNIFEKEVMIARKYRVITTLATQLHHDFPPSLVSLATNTFICNIPSVDAEKFIKEKYGISDDEMAAMKPFVGTSGVINNKGRGLLYIGAIKQTSSLIIQPIVSILPKSLVWQLASETEDETIRTRLQKRVGSNVRYDQLCVELGEQLGYPNMKSVIKEESEELGLSDVKIYEKYIEKVLSGLRLKGFSV